MNDNPETETTPVRVVTDDEKQDHWADYPPGTPAIAEHGALTRGEIERDLLRRVRSLERRVDDHGIKVDSLHASRTFWRRIFFVVGPLLLAGIGALALYVADRISESSKDRGATAAELKALSKQIDNLQQEVLMLLKLSGLDPSKSLSVSALTQADVHPLACSGDHPCTTDQQCRDLFSTCRVCVQNQCAAVLPADPVPVAGITPTMITTTTTKGHDR